MKSEFQQNELDSMITNPENYKLYFFYFNRLDPRILVPKRIHWLGWTLNFGNLYSYVLLFFVILIIVVSNLFFR